MCAVCTTSMGPDRYGPVYQGRFGLAGGQPARLPWLEPKFDPSCPGCRVGAVVPGEPGPPMVAPPPYSPAALSGVAALASRLGVGWTRF